MNYVLKNEHCTLTLSDLGAEMISLKSPSGYEFLWQGREGLWSMQAPILFPLCGSFADERYTVLGKDLHIGLHGFALKSTFKLTEKTDNSVEFCLLSNDKTREEFPFEFELYAKYTLIGEEILFEAKVKNCSDEVMPYMFGWHPGFNLPTDKGQDVSNYEIALGVDKVSWTPFTNGNFFTDNAVDYILADGSYHLNTDEIYPNDTMIFTKHKNEARMFAKGHSYELYMNWSENLPTLCLWKEPEDDAKFICVEPWCEFNKDGINDQNFDKRRVPRLMPAKEHDYFFKLKVRE